MEEKNSEIYSFPMLPIKNRKEKFAKLFFHRNFFLQKLNPLPMIFITTQALPISLNGKRKMEKTLQRVSLFS